MSAVSNINERVRVVKRPYPKIDDAVKYVVSFEPEYSNLVEVSPISSTKAWVYNLLKLRLIDIEDGSILYQYEAEGSFYRLHGIDDKSVTFLDLADNIIIKLGFGNGKNCLSPFIDVNAGNKRNPKNKVDNYMIRKSGEIVVCLTRKEGQPCLQKSVAYIQLYSSDGNFIRETKLQQSGKNLCGTIISVAEINDKICIAAEHGISKNSDWVVFLNSDFKPCISYDGLAGAKFHPSSIAGTHRDQLLIVVHDQLKYIDIIDKFGNFIRNLPVESFSPEGPPNTLAVDSDDKAWILTCDNRIVCVQLYEKQL